MCICRSIVRGHRICSRAGRLSTNVTGTQSVYFLFKCCCRSGFFRTKVCGCQTSVLDNLLHFCCKFSGLYASVNSIIVILQFGVNLIPVFISGFYIVEILRTVLIQSIVCRFTRHSVTLPL